MADQEEDFSSLPLTERFVHKIWKVRKEAYEDAAKQFEKTPAESDPAFRPFLQDPSLWKGAVADSNVAAQQEGSNALCAFLKYGGHQACTRSRNHTISPLVEKGLSSTRPNAKANALEALLLYIELDVAAPVIDDLLPSLSHKQPKIIAATLAALTAIFHAYGCKVVDPKPVLKALPKIFGHADKNVRAEGQNLAKELYRWLREAMKPLFWGDLKPVQQQDLEAIFEKVKAEEAPKQERLLRSQQEAAAAAQASGVSAMPEDDADDVDDAGAVDAFDLSEPVDVSKKIPADFYENLASTKWKDRKEALDALHAAVNVPRIKDGEYGEVVRSLAKCMKDANIAVVTVAANCVEALANGLRKGFGKNRSIIQGPVMERLKEKKQAVADALGAALDAVFLATSLSECLEETLDFTKHKNPQVKLESVKFLIRCLRNTRIPPSKSEVKSISDAATKLLTESSEVLRSAAAEILGTVMKIMGERSMNPYLEGLDEIRKTKIKEYCANAEVKAKDRPKPIIVPAAKAPPLTAKKTLGKRPPGSAGPKKPAAVASLDEPESAPTPTPTPMRSKTQARPIASKLGGPPKSGLAAPGGGLKLQKRLAGPGGAAPPQVATPRRQSIQARPPSRDSEPVEAAPRFGVAGRGLAGRPLGKPIPSAPSADTYPTAPASNISSVERAELEEFRAEKERLQRANEELRSERSRMHSQIHELQNQNAQLIEDHTRDVLSIKAKETQLVRARSDAEAAEQLCARQQREMERLKRELSRAVRATSPAPNSDVAEQIYRDTGLNGGPAGTGGAAAVAAAYSRGVGAAGNKRRSFAARMESSEEKENSTFDPRSGKMVSPPLSSGMSSGAASGGRGSPTMAPSSGHHETSTARGEGIESWKRAAEVTSQLKARIELMKVKPPFFPHPLYQTLDLCETRHG
ncbi:MAG: hypothetical protein M1825_003962 [Sarcosagium campestre]|nr:MAG: hypothetical protein M1825_003962 [Sarcosagium campestre]